MVSSKNSWRHKKKRSLNISGLRVKKPTKISDTVQSMTGFAGMQNSLGSGGKGIERISSSVAINIKVLLISLKII